MPTALELQQLAVGYGSQILIDEMSIAIERGDIACFLGASGCGKSTLLRVIAGFESPLSGQLLIDSQIISSVGQQVPPELRRVGMVFQDFALFPHLTVAENVAFGLHKHTANERRQRVAELLEMVDLEAIADVYPHILSGGQQQRVALARAMAPRPQILLLDEPFSNMDVELREELAMELRRILKLDQVTTILVSHNQLEAFAMADRIGVIHDRQIVQWDDAFNLYHRPSCRYVADFVGEGVLVPGRVSANNLVETVFGSLSADLDSTLSVGTGVEVLLRPDDVLIEPDASVSARVERKLFRGAEYLYTLALADDTQVLSLMPSHAQYALGDSVHLRLVADHVVVFKK